MSVDSTGIQGFGYSGASSVSSDGRYVAFVSWAGNLVPGDTNQTGDVFVHDTLTGQTSLVSLNSRGAQGNYISHSPSISVDGRVIVFYSDATNLVSGDTNGVGDIFAHDRLIGLTKRVSVNSNGGQGNLACFKSATAGDGRFVAFASIATNMVPGDYNDVEDIFLHDRLTGLTSCVSLSSAGVLGNGFSYEPSISADGKFIAFWSSASNLVTGDTNGAADVFVRDLNSSLTTRVSLNSVGVQGNDSSGSPSISASGRHVSFMSWATNLVSADTNLTADFFVHDRQSGQTSRVSVDSFGRESNHLGYKCSISVDGRYVAFDSYADNLVLEDTNGVMDVFLHDRQLGQTTRISVDSAAAQGNAVSASPHVSEDGRYLTFWSSASNLVPGDTNLASDTYVHDRFAIVPLLNMTGTCPGLITLTARNVTAAGTVLLLYGPAGVFVNPSQPCAALRLGISPPVPGALVTADGSGIAVLSVSAPANLCGRVVQAVDVTTCTATNVVVL